MSIYRIDAAYHLERRLRTAWFRFRAWPRCETCGTLLRVTNGKTHCPKCEPNP